jgi:outer membrane protein
MKKQIIFIAFLLIASTAFSQMKIGYANLEFILRNLPEAKQMNKDLEVFQKKLEEQIVAKQEYYQSLLKDYYDKEQKGFSESLLSSMRTQISSLENEIKTDAANADAMMANLSAQKLRPITDKITEAVNQVYKEGGYTYIFNSADGTGNSIVLKGPEGENLTYRILEKLGVKLEEE